MKKRLLSALLALALVFVLLPTTALAGVTRGSDYDISINGTNYVFSDSETCYFKSSFTSTEPSSPYLKLTKSSDTITVTVSGYVTVSDISVHNNFSTQDKINLIITGNKGSTLNIECKDTYGAALETYQSGDITIKGGITVNANFSANNTNRNTDCHGISASKNLIITGKGTTVNAVNADHDAAAVKVGGNITVSDGAQLNATNKYYGSNNTDKAYAIKCGQLSISGNNTKVTAKTSNGKQAISGTVSDGDKLTFKVPLAGSTLYQKPMDEALKYTHVEITQAPTDPYVLIAGEPAIMDQETPIPGGTGTYLYKKTTYNGSFLTLKGVDITGTKDGPARFIQFGKNGYYTIELKGENKISGFSSGIVAPNDSGVNDVTVVLSGSGSLDISANQYAIDMQVGNLKFENTGKIMLTTGYKFTYPLNALRVKTGSVTIDKAKYDIVGVKQDKDGTREDISDNPNLDTILKGTSTDKDLYFKSITITPAAAKPSTIRYNGTTLKQGETIKDGKGGTATVDRENNTITLKNFNGTAALSFDATLADSTLVLEGTNTLSSIVTTQKGLTISGSGSLTVGSIQVPNNTKHTANLTITGGAAVIAGTATSDAKAIDITGNLTVNSGATLTATNASETNPTIDVTGNVTISGDPGTNAYTVSAHNSYNVQKDRDGHLSASGVPSAIKIGGTLNISAGARVMAQTDSYGAGVMLGQNSTITVEDAFLSAQNSSCDFAAISFSGYMGDINVSGENGKVVAENTHTNIGQSLALKAINAFVYNRNTDFYLKMQSEGVIDEEIIAPGGHNASGGKKVTITRGDEVTRTNSPVDIDGHTLLNDTYYTITNDSTVVANGSESNYNAFYNSTTKTLNLNNAKISTTTENAAIKIGEDSTITTITVTGTNELKGNHNHCIESYDNFTINGTGTLNMTNTNSSSSATSVIHCGPGKSLTIAAEVIIKNEAKPGNLIFTVKKDAYSFAEGYNVYASTDVSGSPLETYDAAKSSTYKYLCVTTKTLETGGGSTHQHVWDEAWHDTGDYHHAHQCTICKAYDTTTQELHNVTGHKDNHDGSHSNICGSCGYSAKVSHSYTWAPNANDNEKHIGTCVCGNVVEKYHNFVGDVCSDCGYNKSTGTTCEHVWTTEWTIDTVDNEYHWHKCIKCNAITDKKPHAYTIVTDSGTNHIRECECKVFYVEDHISSDWIIDTPATATTAGSMHKECTVCKHKMQTEVIPATGEIVPPTPDNPGTIVIIRPAEEEKPAQQPNPSTGANDLVGLAVAAAVAAALGSAALLRKHD